jgi:precorrin-6x reductase
LEAEETDQHIPEALKKPKISWSYLITRFFPWNNNRTMDTLAEVMDITTIIKKLKVTKRNVVHFVGAENISSR